MWEQHLEGSDINLVQGRGGYDPARPTLLMVHGSGGRAQSYLPQLSGLARDFNVASIDMPGHGQTPGPTPQRVEEYSRWLGDFLAAGPIRPVVMGHSLGGAVILQLALERPRLIKGLILLGTGSRLRVMPAILDGIKADFESTAAMVVRYSYAAGADERTIDQGIEELSANDPKTVWSNFTACDNFDVSARLNEITMPTLVLVGEQDQLTPMKYSEFLAKGIAGAQLKVIENGGHMVNVEQHKAVNQAIAGFMAQR